MVVSSGGHSLSPVVFEDIHFEHRPYDPWSAYGPVKDGQRLLFAVELARRGTPAFAVHPGMVATGLGRHLDPGHAAGVAKRAPP